MFGSKLCWDFLFTVFKLNCAYGLQVESQKNVKQRTKRKDQNNVFKMDIYSRLYLGLCWWFVKMDDELGK